MGLPYNAHACNSLRKKSLLKIRIFAFVLNRKFSSLVLVFAIRNVGDVYIANRVKSRRTMTLSGLPVVGEAIKTSRNPQTAADLGMIDASIRITFRSTSQSPQLSITSR